MNKYAQGKTLSRVKDKTWKIKIKPKKLNINCLLKLISSNKNIK